MSHAMQAAPQEGGYEWPPAGQAAAERDAQDPGRDSPGAIRPVASLPVADLRETLRREGEFLAILAQQLHGPLAPMRNAVHILRISEGDAAATAAARMMIERQIKQLMRVIDELQDVARAIQGKLDILKSRVSLTSVVQIAVDTSRPVIDGRQQQLSMTAPAEALYVDADTGRLAQALSNLLSDGARLSEVGTQLDVAIERQGQYATVTISDGSMDLPRQLLQQVFEPFCQVELGNGRTLEGLGMGLALARQLVELHGGTLEARSSGSGAGAQLIVRLPLAATTLPETTGMAEQSRQPIRMLVADDNCDAAQSLSTMFVLAGYDVRTAYDGLEALEIAEEFRPEVLLLDIGMPRLNGYAATRRIRESTWGRSALIVAVTGFGQAEDQRRSFEAGFDHHLTKPVDPQSLIALLERELSQRRRAEAG